MNKISVIPMLVKSHQRGYGISRCFESHVSYFLRPFEFYIRIRAFLESVDIEIHVVCYSSGPKASNRPSSYRGKALGNPARHSSSMYRYGDIGYPDLQNTWILNILISLSTVTINIRLLKSQRHWDSIGSRSCFLCRHNSILRRAIIVLEIGFVHDVQIGCCGITSVQEFACQHVR